VAFFPKRKRKDFPRRHGRPVFSAADPKDPLEAFLEQAYGVSLDELEVFCLRWEDSAREKDCGA
jgi:hypothetical protein